MSSKTVVTITGIRPDFIRMAYVFRELDRHPSIRHVMIHTGQHYDELLSGAFFKDLGLRKPDFTLACGHSSSNHYEQLAYLSTAIIECFKTNTIHPDLILFLGDANTVAAALPLKKEGYKIGHIEAGMRSFDRRMLEEINRTVCDVCTDVFFVYHEDYKNHLLAEGVDPKTRPIYVVGNTVVEPANEIISKIGLRDQVKRKDMILMDVHRPENFLYPDRLRSIFAFGSRLAKDYGLPVECLSYGRLLKVIEEEKIDLGEVKLTHLLSFPDYLTKVYHAAVLISDSGTGQEEPALLDTPVIVPRDFSERPQSYSSNCSMAFPAEAKDQEGVYHEILKKLEDYEAKRIVPCLKWLGVGVVPSTSTSIMRGIEDFLF